MTLAIEDSAAEIGDDELAFDEGRAIGIVDSGIRGATYATAPLIEADATGLLELARTDVPGAARPPRRCEYCTRVMRRDARADAVTCGKRCRQKRWRKRRAQVSRKVIDARHISDVARRRAFDDGSVPTYVPSDGSSKRGLVSGRVCGVEVAIE